MRSHFWVWCCVMVKGALVIWLSLSSTATDRLWLFLNFIFTLSFILRGQAWTYFFLNLLLWPLFFLFNLFRKNLNIITEILFCIKNYLFMRIVIWKLNLLRDRRSKVKFFFFIIKSNSSSILEGTFLSWLRKLRILRKITVSNLDLNIWHSDWLREGSWLVILLFTNNYLILQWAFFK